MLENTNQLGLGRQSADRFCAGLTDCIYWQLWDVVVHPDYQRRRREMMNRVLSYPVLSKVEKFWLNTRDKFDFYEARSSVRTGHGRENLIKGDGCDRKIG
jgi:hypothetical protein